MSPLHVTGFSSESGISSGSVFPAVAASGNTSSNEKMSRSPAARSWPGRNRPATTSMPADSINRSSNRTPSAPWRDSRTIEASRKEAAVVRRTAAAAIALVNEGRSGSSCRIARKACGLRLSGQQRQLGGQPLCFSVSDVERHHYTYSTTPIHVASSVTLTRVGQLGHTLFSLVAI